MRILRHLATLAAAAAASLLPPAGAAVLVSGWPAVPGDGLRAATLPPGEGAADLSLEPGRANDLFLAWTENGGTLLRVQRLTDAGAPAFGSTGVVVRSGPGLSLGPAGSRRPGDARGPIDLVSTSDGGVIVAWTEASPFGRDLRAQRLGPAGAAQWAFGGLPLLQGLSLDGGDAAVASDGNDGVFATGVFGVEGKGVVRFNRALAAGSAAYPVPGLAVDAATEGKSGPAVEAFPGGEAALCWLRLDGNGLRFQVVDGSGTRLADGGMALGPATEGFPGMRAAGSSIPGSILVAHRQSGGVQVKLVTALGQVLRDETAGLASLSGPPEVTAANTVVSGLPGGIEVKGIRPSGEAVRLVRGAAGAWLPLEVVAPPVDPEDGAAGALRGPGWFFDLGPSGGPSPGRVTGYRVSSPDPTTLDPVPGPWLAAAPGDAPFLRTAASGAWVFSAWVASSGGIPAVVAARAGASGGLDVLDARGLVMRRATVKRPPSGSGVLKVVAPEVSLPAERDPETGKAALPPTFRLRVGSERGTAGDLALLAWKGTKRLAWKATVAGPGGMTGTVKAGPLGRYLRIRVKGFPADPGERVLSVRVDLGGASQAATVLLEPRGRTGRKALFR